MINPKTGRAITVPSKDNKYKTTKAYTNLLKEFDYDERKKLFIPKDKSLYSFSKNQNRYIPKSKISNKYNAGETITLKDEFIKSPTGRIIKRDGRAFNKFIKLGYRAEEGILFKPKKTTKIRNASYDNFDKNKFKNVKLITLTIPETGEKYIHYYKNIKDFTQWYRAVNYQWEGLDNELDLIETDDTIKFGVSYDGKLNCFIQALETHISKQRTKTFDKSLYEKYQDGVFEDDIEELAHQYKLFIRVKENNNTYEYGKQEYKKNKTILNLEYKNNHMEILSQTIEKPTVHKIKPCNCIDKLSFNFEHTCQSLNDIIPTIDLTQIHNLMIDYELNIQAIITKTEIYKYSHYKDLELKDNEFSLINKVSNEIMDYFTIKPQPIHTNHNIVKQFCHNQQFFNTMIKSHITYECLDIKNAYDNFEELPTDLIIQITTDTLHDEIGFYYITFKCPIRKQVLSEWRSDKYVKILQKHNIPITIQQAMLSTSKTYLDINTLNSKYKHYDKRYFHKILGQWQKYKFSKTQITTDFELCLKYGGFEIYPNLYKFVEDEFISSKNYYPHIVGYIHEYTNCRILDTLLTYKLEPLRIWVDGIILKQLPKEYPSYFRVEKKEYRNDYEPLHYEDHKPLEITYNKLNLPDTKLSAILGSAGTGKSHTINNIYNNTINSVILCPTNMACKNFEKSYTIDSYINQPIKKQYDLMLIDECSMVNQYTLNTLLKFNTKIILFGDTNQLQTVSGKPIDYTNINITKLTKIYRQENPEFIDCLYDTLETGNLDYIKSTMTVEECIKNDITILSCINAEIYRINKIGYKLNKNKVVDKELLLKVNSPVILTSNYFKNTKSLVNGDQGIITSQSENNVIITILDKEYEFSKKQLKHFEPAYSITYHKIQGQTLNKPICLNTIGLNYFDEQKNNMLYVGVSRVRKLEHLKLLVSENNTIR